MVSRRQILKAGAVGAAAALPSIEARAATTSQPENGSAKPTPSAGRSRETLFFFNGEEAKFIEAAIDRLIPGDDHWGGAKAAGGLFYIDGQLSGAYGAGARIYLKGPWSPEASAQHGYQLRYAPAELYRIAIAEIRDHARTSMGGRDVWKLKGEELDSLLSDLENGKVQLPSLPAPVFFETLLAN